MIAAAGCRRRLLPSWCSWSGRDRVWDAQSVRPGVGGGVVLYGVVLVCVGLCWFVLCAVPLCCGVVRCCVVGCAVLCSAVLFRFALV